MPDTVGQIRKQDSVNTVGGIGAAWKAGQLLHRAKDDLKLK